MGAGMKYEGCHSLWHAGSWRYIVYRHNLFKYKRMVSDDLVVVSLTLLGFTFFWRSV